MKIVTGLLTFLALCAFGAPPVEARDCRLPHLPGKNAARPPPGCDLPPKSQAGSAARLKQQNGFIDLGNGTQVRISGRVRMDVGTRH